MPRQVYPKLIEFEYANALVAMVRNEIRPGFAPLLHELPGLLQRANAERARTDVAESRRARELIDIARHHMAAAMNPHRLEALATTFADRAQRYNREQLGRQVQATLGVDIMTNSPRMAALVDHFVQENVALIKSIPDTIATGVDKLTTRAFASGQRHEDLAREIQGRFDVGESRARLIARDQIGKIYGATNAARQQDLGVTSFVWRTAGDERVRPEHEDLNGETFRYDDPPDEGLPGEPVQCRCYAEPVFDQILGDVNTDDDGGASADQPALAASGGDSDAEVYEPQKNPK